jgi:hypothetical protein
VTARVRSSLLLATAAFFLSGFLPALAITGTVIDKDQQPIEGARICYWVNQTDQICVFTDEGGFFRLPDGPGERMRILAKGFLPRILPAAEQPGPIVLTRSATLLVVVVDDATGEGIDGATGEVAWSSGRHRNFVTNRAGARLKTLNPGRVAVSAYAEGYDMGGPEQVRLTAGEEARVEIRMQRSAPVEERQPEAAPSREKGS